MVATLQAATALSCAYVLCFDILVEYPCYASQWLQFPLGGLALSGLAFACATSFTTFVPTTVERSLAQSVALRRFLLSLVADDIERVAATSAGSGNLKDAWRTSPNMTSLSATVTAKQLLSAFFLTAGDGVPTAFPRGNIEIGQGSLPTWAMGDHVHGAGAMR
jgi:hypothetical protein